MSVNDFETISLIEERNQLIEEFRDVSFKALRSQRETRRFWLEERKTINQRVTEITARLGDSKNRSFNNL